MAPSLQSIVPTRLPILRGRRVVVIDSGSHSLKLLLLRLGLGGVRILWKECIDLRQEGLLSPGDISLHLRKRLQELDYDQIALVLPQHLSISQIIDLPSENESAVSDLIQDEIVRLSGLSESAIVYHYSRIRPFCGYRNPFWVTLSKESEVVRQVEDVTSASPDVCDVTSPASAMLAAFQAQAGLPACALLVNLGAENTVVVIVLEGQGVFVTTFPVGGNTFTQLIAVDLDVPVEEAEDAKCSRNLFEELDRLARFRSGVEDWCSQTARAFQEWTKEHRVDGESLRGFEVLLCGGGAEQNGLAAQLQARVGLKVTCWEGEESDGSGVAPCRFTVAYGAALHVFGKSSQSASLLPANLREAHNRVRSANKLRAFGITMMLLAAAILSAGIWHQLRLVNRKNAILANTHIALAQARNADRVLADLAADYERLRPLVERQKTTWDTLRTLSLLQSARSNQNFWFLLFADQQSYFSSPNGASGTNPPALFTNQIAGNGFRARTNEFPGKRGFIAELCIPNPGSNLIPSLSHIVTNLRKAPLFRNVDTLPAGLRRDWVDRKLIVPDRDFALTIDLVENEFQKPVATRPQSVLPSFGAIRPAGRTFREQAEIAIRPQPEH